MKPWLSILIPTIHKDDTVEFIDSLNSHSESMNGIELVIDDQGVGDREVVIKFERCIEKASADWVWLANDDLICETQGWDVAFKYCIEKFPDQIALFFPNDMIFGIKFACFPLVNKHVIKNLFPMPYHRYKMDDTIYEIYPSNRRFYLPNVIMRHLNIVNDEYKVNPALAAIDNLFWKSEKSRRISAKEELCNRLRS